MNRHRTRATGDGGVLRTRFLWRFEVKAGVLVYRLEGGPPAPRLENKVIFKGPARLRGAAENVLDAGSVCTGPPEGSQGSHTRELPAGFDAPSTAPPPCGAGGFPVNLAAAICG